MFICISFSPVYRILLFCVEIYFTTVRGTEKVSIAVDTFSHIDSSLKPRVSLLILCKQLTSKNTHRVCDVIRRRPTVNKTSDRRKRLVVSHFSKNGVLNLEFNEPVEVNQWYLLIVMSILKGSCSI